MADFWKWERKNLDRFAEEVAAQNRALLVQNAMLMESNRRLVIELAKHGNLDLCADINRHSVRAADGAGCAAVGDGRRPEDAQTLEALK